MQDDSVIDMIPTFKCVLVGDSGVGKTTFLKRHLTGEFQEQHVPTLGVEVHPLVFSTTRGKIRFVVWDTAGKEEYHGLGDGHYAHADCAIVMFDVTSLTTYEKALFLRQDLFWKCGNIPIVLCGNKSDMLDPNISQTLRVSVLDPKYYEISAKNLLRFEKPFRLLASYIFDDALLRFIKSPPMEPAKDEAVPDS